jgi:hypothetical protein
MGQFKTIEEYQQRVIELHKQIRPFVDSSHLDASEFIVRFTPGAGHKMFLDLLEDELCLVNIYGQDARGYIHEEHVFFAGGGGPGAWNNSSAKKIREWFKKNAPEVKLWSGK